MNSIQLEIIHHTKKQEGLKLNEKNTIDKCQNQDDKDVEILYKHFEAAVIKMLQSATTNMFETNKKNRKSHQRNIKSPQTNKNTWRTKWKF